MITWRTVALIFLVAWVFTALVAWQGWHRAATLKEMYTQQVLSNTDGLNLLYRIELKRSSALPDSLRKQLDDMTFLANYWRKNGGRK